MAGALAFAGVLAGCGDDVTVAPDPQLDLSPPSATIAVGQSVTFSATVTGTNNKAVTWASSDQTKASVDANGKVTGVAAGVATITATATGAQLTKSALVTVTALSKGVQKVEIAPSNAIIKQGDFIQLAANVTRDPGVAGTVTWASSATAIATVDATGKVTAVTNGSAIITAASTVDPTVTGTAAITVRALAPAQVSIKTVTQGGTTNPVNFNNVFGQVDVVYNVDPGDQVVTKVDVLIDGAIACSNSMSVSESEQLRLAAAFPDRVQAAEQVCSINTAAFNTTTGAVTYPNGAHQLSVKATIGGTQPGNVSSSSQALNFQNTSGFIALVSNTNTNAGFPANAINTTTGRNWIAGNVTLKLAAVNYAGGGATVTSLNASFLGKTFTDTPDAGTQIFTIDFPNSGTGATNIVGYQTAALGETMPVINSSNLSNGNQGSTTILNIGATAVTLGLTKLDSTRVDNVAPLAPTVGAFPTWVRSAFAFDSTAAGVSNVSDAGVDAVTLEFQVIKGALPTATACDLTGMTKVTTAQGLTETVSTDYNGKVVITDALGNRRCASFGNAFGADFGAPSDVTLSGVSNQQGFNSLNGGTAGAAATNYTVASSGDTLSGLPTSNPALISIIRTGATSANNACVVGTGTFSTCAAIAAPDIASVTGGTTIEGYYALTAQMTDVAGNAAPTPALTRNYVVDATLPAFAGGLVLSTTYAGNAPAAFGGISVSDNLDLGNIFGQVSYTAAGINLEFPSQSMGAFGAPLEKSFSGTYTIPSLIRCMAPAAGPWAASNTNKAQDITLFGFDQAGNFATKAPVAGDFVSRVADCGIVGYTAASGFSITAFDQPTVAYGAGKTDVDIDGANVATTSATSVSLQTVAHVSLNAGNPFSRVEFYYLNPTTGGYVLIGQASGGSPNQTVTERTWTYNLTWDPPAGVPVGAVTIIAVGVDAEGDAARTATQTVTTVQ